MLWNPTESLKFDLSREAVPWEALASCGWLLSGYALGVLGNPWMIIAGKGSPLKVLRRACRRTAFRTTILYFAGQSLLGGIEALGSEVLTDVLQRFQGARKRLHCRSAWSKLLTTQHPRSWSSIADKRSAIVHLGRGQQR